MVDGFWHTFDTVYEHFLRLCCKKRGDLIVLCQSIFATEEKIRYL